MLCRLVRCQSCHGILFVPAPRCNILPCLYAFQYNAGNVINNILAADRTRTLFFSVCLCRRRGHSGCGRISPAGTSAQSQIYYGRCRHHVFKLWAVVTAAVAGAVNICTNYFKTAVVCKRRTLTDLPFDSFLMLLRGRKASLDNSSVHSFIFPFLLRCFINIKSKNKNILNFAFQIFTINCL